MLLPRKHTNRYSDLDAIVWWCRWLQTVPIEQWSDEVRADFHSLIGADPEEWYAPDDRIDLWLGDGIGNMPELHNDGDPVLPEHLVIRINVTETNENILDWIQYELLEDHREKIGFRRTAGHPEFTQWRAKWKFSRRPDNNLMAIYWDVWNADKKLPRWKVAEQIGAKHGIASESRKMDDGPDRRKALGDVVTRYLKAIDKLRAGVAQGVFPA
jgi:hypothetical protein